MVDVTELRKAAKCIYIAVEESVAKDISQKLLSAADEIEELRNQIKDAFFMGYAFRHGRGDKFKPEKAWAEWNELTKDSEPIPVNLPFDPDNLPGNSPRKIVPLHDEPEPEKNNG